MAEEKKKPERASETMPLKLGWKWHLRTLSIIFASIFAFLIIYTLVMGNRAVKRVVVGVDYLKRAEFIRNADSGSAKAQIMDSYNKIDVHYVRLSQLVRELESTLVVQSCNDTDIRNLNNIIIATNESYDSIKGMHAGVKLNSTFTGVLKKMGDAKDSVLKGVKKDLTLTGNELRFFQERGYILFDFKEYKSKVQMAKGIWDEEEALTVASTELQNAISNDYKCLDAYYYLAKVFRMQGLEDDAVERYAECVKASKINFIEKFAYLFVSWPKGLKRVKPEMAIADLNVIKKEKESAGIKYQDVYFFLGEAYYTMGKNKEAEAELRKALEIDKEGLWSRDAEELLKKIGE